MLRKNSRRRFRFSLSSIKPFFFRWFNADKLHRVRLLMERLEDRVTPTASWTGGGGNNLWSNAANWNGGVVPTSSDNVSIQSQFAGTTIIVDGAANAGRIDSSAPIELDSGGSFTVAGSRAASTLQNGLTLKGGTLTATGEVDLTAGTTSTFKFGTITGGTISGTGVTGGLHNFGTITDSVSSQITLDGDMANESGAQFNLSANVNPAITGSGTLVNRSGATFALSGSGTIGVSHLQNDGAVTVARATRRSSPAAALPIPALGMLRCWERWTSNRVRLSTPGQRSLGPVR